VPGFGDIDARIVVVGLAPGAHGANRTGRIFTGDRSGEFLYGALYRCGLASQPRSVARDDGLVLRGAFITCPVKCAPPENRPSPSEIDNCSNFLSREMSALKSVRVFLALGSVAHKACLDYFARIDVPIPKPRPAFAHGSEVKIGPYVLLCSYHVSQQNTQTGRLTPAMFDAVLKRALVLSNPVDA
jgi:uracil-DNA glycosylase family 4